MDSRGEGVSNLVEESFGDDMGQAENCEYEKQALPFLNTPLEEDDDASVELLKEQEDDTVSPITRLRSSGQSLESTEVFNSDEALQQKRVTLEHSSSFNKRETGARRIPDHAERLKRIQNHALDTGGGKAHITIKAGDGLEHYCAGAARNSIIQDEELGAQSPHKSNFIASLGGKANKGRVFADGDAMKEKVRQAIRKIEYNVFDHYHEEGYAQLIAKHPMFDYVTLSIIFMNSIWISIDLDYNPEDILVRAPPIFQVVEHLFCTYFVLEWLVRFCAFKEKLRGLYDGWFVFDSALVLFMILETWIMSVVVLATSNGGSTGLGNTDILKLIRLVRLTRMARLARLLRAIPELTILIKGLLVASRSVLFTLFLLLIIIYFFAIMFRQLSDGTDLED